LFNIDNSISKYIVQLKWISYKVEEKKEEEEEKL